MEPPIEHEVESCVRGHHIYQRLWTPTVGEELECEREASNNMDSYAVAVVRGGVVVGHVPRTISAACSLFLSRNGSIHCTVTGVRRHSHDLPQGGLEVPCKLKFKGRSIDVKKVTKLLALAERREARREEIEQLDQVSLSENDDQTGDHIQHPDCTDDRSASSQVVSTVEQPDKVEQTVEPLHSVEPSSEPAHCSNGITKTSPIIVDNITMQAYSQKEWLRIDHHYLSIFERDIIISGDWLTDKHINFAQHILKKQHVELSGLTSSLLLHKISAPITSPALQILHCRGNHWIVVSSIGCSIGSVKVYDSLYQSVDEKSNGLITKIFGAHKVTMMDGPRQSGTKDCGVFSIATATLLANNGDPRSTIYDQETMREHLCQCFESVCLTPFPTKHI